MDIDRQEKLFVHQIFEGLELLGFETRNKYEILNSEKRKIGFAAEQQKGVLGFFMRQLFGHWRPFEIHFFNDRKENVMKALHPFRFFFQHLEVVDKNGEKLGALQQRFSFFTKKFDVLNHDGEVIMNMASPFWKIWTFPFFDGEKERARISKKWSGTLTEIFTDKDKFLVEFMDSNLNLKERKVILASSVFIDLQYFERKAGK